MSDTSDGASAQEIISKVPPALDLRYLLVPRPEETLIRERSARFLDKTRRSREIMFLLAEIDKLRGALRYREILAASEKTPS
jgi:hypothetical protein